MTTTNGNAGPHPTRRFRFDGRVGPMLLGAGYSGRRFVTVALVVVLVLAVGLYLALRVWRARYLERREFGARRVATAVDRLAELTPAGVPPADWREAVEGTHRMLVELTSSGANDRATLEKLRADLSARVAGARPETAVAVLTRIWADMERFGGPALAHAECPRPLDLALAVNPLDRVAPEGVPAGAWSRALDETRVMLVALAASGKLGPDERAKLRQEWAERTAAATPGTAVAALGRIWDDAERSGGPVVARRPRPDLLGPSTGSTQ